MERFSEKTQFFKNLSRNEQVLLFATVLSIWQKRFDALVSISKGCRGSQEIFGKIHEIIQESNNPGRDVLFLLFNFKISKLGQEQEKNSLNAYMLLYRIIPETQNKHDYIQQRFKIICEQYPLMNKIKSVFEEMIEEERIVERDLEKARLDLEKTNKLLEETKKQIARSKFRCRILAFAEGILIAIFICIVVKRIYISNFSGKSRTLYLNQ